MNGVHEITVRLNEQEYKKLKLKLEGSMKDFFISNFYFMENIEDSKKQKMLMYILRNIEIISSEMRELDDYEYLYSLDKNIARLQSIIDIIKEKSNENKKDKI